MYFGYKSCQRCDLQTCFLSLYLSCQFLTGSLAEQKCLNLIEFKFFFCYGHAFGSMSNNFCLTRVWKIFSMIYIYINDSH